MQQIFDIVTAYVAQKSGFNNLPQCRADSIYELRDVSFPLHSIGNEKAEEIYKNLSTELAKDVCMLLFNKLQIPLLQPIPLLESVILQKGFLNIKLNRAETWKIAAKCIVQDGDNYGKSDKHKGKRVVIEHTSTNPNSTIHIGNLRNTITGSYIANLHRAVGYTVEEWFYINDLGAQIGLTYVGFRRIYPILKPYLKIDLWIGIIYAVCNTLQNIQDIGWVLNETKDVILNNKEDELISKIIDNKARDEAANVCNVYRDIYSRHSQMMDILIKELNGINIKKEAGQWNLRYENADPEAVKEFRRMVNLTLSGQQETLDTYGVRHQNFAYESELGWEQSNDRVLKVLKETKYFHPQTQKNEKGIPEGGYLDLAQFLTDSGLAVGKRGYQKDYPRLYILRPDGSTLYTFRDIVFSIKKGDNADIVYNVICTEQNLSQEKVQLGLRLISPQIAEKQWHLSYELVRLVGRRMSGRRGIFVTADEVYKELKEGTAEISLKRKQEKEELLKKRKEASDKNKETNEQQESKIEDIDEQITSDNTPEAIAAFERINHHVAVAAMKFSLISCSLHTELVIDVAKATNPDEASAPFLLYNYARFCSVIDRFESSVASGKIPPLCQLDQVDWKLLDGNAEWKLLMKYAVMLPGLVEQIACPVMPQRPSLPNFPVHLLPEYLINFVREFSSFYHLNRIIQDGQPALTHARIWLCKIFRQVLGNGLKFIGITPLERM